MTYATDTFTGDGSTVEFTLTFDYIQRDHVKVYRVVTATEAETELTVITSGSPGDDEYIWETDDKIKVGLAPTTDQQLSIRRETPENEQIVDWADGSFIIAQDLNTADRQFLFNIQELDDRISALDTESIKFKGTIDLTTDDPPASPSNGDLYVNSGSGTVKDEWIGIAGDDVVGAEQVLWSSADEEWQIIDTPASQSGVLGVTGTAPITVDNTDDQNPIVGISAATTSDAGSMSAADKAKLDGLPDSIPPGTTVSDTAPADPETGELWFNTNDNRLYVYTGTEFIDASPEAAQVQSDWDQTDTTAADFIENKPTIPAAQIQSDWDQTDTAAVDFIENKPTILPDAPSDGNTYGREDGAWVEVTGGGTAGVTSIVAGDNITIDPAGGTGDVTINSTGGDTSGASAWGNVESDGTLADGLNITSVTRSDTGEYEVVFAVAMPNADYCITTTCLNTGRFIGVTDKTANGFTANARDAGGTNFDLPFCFAVHATNGIAPLTGGTGTDAWADVQADGTVDASFNIDSITRNGTGDYSVVFTTPMPTGNYSIATGLSNVSSNNACLYSSKTLNGFDIGTYSSGSRADNGFSFAVNASNAVLPNTLDEETIRAAAQNPGASAWANYDGTTETINGSLNISSITRTGSGVYDVVFTTPMPNANYSVTVGGNEENGAQNLTANGFQIVSTNGDTSRVFFAVFATNALPPRRGTGADAWGKFQCSDGTMLGSFNIDRGENEGTGHFRFYFDNPMPDSDYSVVAIADYGGGISTSIANANTESFDVRLWEPDGSASSDATFVNFVVHATNATLPTTFTEEQIQGVIDAGPQGIAKAWLNCDSDGNVAASYNIDSVTDNGTGDLTVTFTDNMADTDYLLTGGAIYSNGTTGFGYVSFWSDGNGNPDNKTASECRVQHGHAQTGTSNAQNVIQTTNGQLQIYMIFYGN